MSDGFGAGEPATIAADIRRKLPVTIEDSVARKRALRIPPSLTVFATEAADTLKTARETHHRFRIKANSFRDLL